MEKIKPVGYLKTTKTAKSHIPELIRRETSTQPGEKIPYVIDARAVLLYDPELTAKDLIASLEVMKDDILLRKEKQQK